MKRVGEYAAGAITFDTFARANSRDWQAMARYLLRRFPSDLDEQDVVQELLIGSWQAMKRFDPARGVSPERYCSFNAIARTKKRLRRQARASEELLGTDPVLQLPETPDPASQVHELERGERLRHLLDRCSSLKDAIVLMAFFREEDRTQTASALYQDPETRRLCRFGSESDAQRKVRQSLNRLKTKGMKCRNQITHR